MSAQTGQRRPHWRDSGENDFSEVRHLPLPQGQQEAQAMADARLSPPRPATGPQPRHATGPQRQATFTPHPGTGPQPAACAPVHHEDPRSVAYTNAPGPGVLRQVADSLDGIDWRALRLAQEIPGLTYHQAASEKTPVGDEARAATRPAGAPRPDLQAAPQPAPAPQPEPAACPYPEGFIRGMLIDRLWDAAEFYAAMDGASCDDCDAGPGRCEWHDGQQAKRRTYRRLHDAAASARTDAEALDRIAAACQAGHADPGDIAGPGSVLGAVLADALSVADGGAR